VVAEPLAAPLTATVPDTGNSITLRQAGPPARLRRRLLLAAGTVALILVAAAVIGFRGRSGESEGVASADTARRPADTGKSKPAAVGKVRVLDDCQQEVMNWWPWSTGTQEAATRTWVTPGKVGKRALQFSVPAAASAHPAGLNFEVAPPLQDWSSYRYLRFWFRGTGSGVNFGISFNGSNRSWNVKDDSPDWREVRIPLLECHTPDGKAGARPEDFRAIPRIVFVVYTAAKGTFQIEQMELTEN
jgi:hypothetical protein